MLPRKHNNISQEAIAAACGVSTMTVSRALRQSPLVSEKTRKQIFEIAAQMGYLRTTRGGRSSKSNQQVPDRVIQLIVGEAGNRMGRFHSELTLSLVRLLAANHFECIIRVSDGNYESFNKMLNAARGQEVEASLIVGNFNNDERRALLSALPGALLLDTVGDEIIESVFSSFSFDNTMASYMAVKHLHATGRRRVALIAGPQDHPFTRNIENGYRNCLANAKIPVDPALICYTDFTSPSAEAAVELLFNRNIKFDAVFTNDEMAGGVYRAILKRNLRIPDDIAVCGCDGLPVGAQLYPALTTMILDHRQLAKHVVDTIISQDLALNPVQLILRPTLLIREST